VWAIVFRRQTMIAPPCEGLGMTVEKLLLPIDLARRPLEMFPLANRNTKPAENEIVFLHVLDRRLDADHHKAD